MQRIYTLILLMLFSIGFVTAQYCGNSGSNVCTPSGTLTQPGLSPASQNFPELINGIASVSSLQFKNFNQLQFGGQTVTVQSLRFDTISNLPSGLCWSSNKANNTFANQEDGCLRISGVACDNPGQYKLNIVVTANVGVPILTNADALGMKYFIRLVNSNQTAPSVDTNQTTPFISFGNAPSCSPSTLSVSLGNNQAVCNGTQVTLNPTITNGQTPYSYSWNAIGNTLSCNNCANPTATITQNSTYTVTVTDANNSTATASVIYTLVNTGSYQITVSGGTNVCQGTNVLLNAGSGYSSYAWSTGAQTQTINVSQSGNYSVTVTTQGGCTLSDSETITVNTPSISNYQITANGPTSFCGGGSVTLNAGAGFTSYSWSTGAQSQTITVNQTNNYTVTVAGTDGCTYTDGQAVNVNTSFAGQQICIVSVDQTTGKNVIVWEISTGFGIDSFKIYRETTIANQYQLIRQQAFGNFSTYTDNASNPQQQSNRYVITTVDACGESSYSTPHKTIHLTSNVGINNEVNLIWNAYEGFNSGFYNIYRGSSSQNMQQIAQVASSNLSYSDLTPPAPPLFYQIEAVNSQGCVPSFKVEDYSSSRSNVVQITLQGVSSTNEQNPTIYSYYNSFSSSNVISWSGVNITPKELRLYDVTGRLVFTTFVLDNSGVSLPNDIMPSLYVAELFVEGKPIYKKVYLK